MELPKGKGPKLPPKGRGGGAAARQRHLDRQRGMEVPCPPEDAKRPAEREKDSKPKKPAPGKRARPDRDGER